MAFSLMILGLPAIASAQWRNDDDYNRNGRNGGYGNGQYGGYGNGQYGGYGNTSSTVRDLKRNSNQFERTVDRELDRSRYNGTNREDQFMDLVRSFDNAVDDLSISNNRQNANEVQNVLRIGSQIDRSMARLRLSGQSVQLWNAIEYDLNALSNAYGYNNGRRNRGWGNGRGNGNTGNNLPSWWPF